MRTHATPRCAPRASASAGVNACLLKPNACPNGKASGSICVNAPGTPRGYDCVCRPGFAPKANGNAGNNAQSCKRESARLHGRVGL